MAHENKPDYPAGLRVWHWLNFVAISVILVTVLLRKTFLAYRSNSALIQEKSAAAGTPVTKAVADEIEREHGRGEEARGDHQQPWRRVQRGGALADQLGAALFQSSLRAEWM